MFLCGLISGVIVLISDYHNSCMVSNLRTFATFHEVNSSLTSQDVSNDWYVYRDGLYRDGTGRISREQRIKCFLTRRETENLKSPTDLSLATVPPYRVIV